MSTKNQIWVEKTLSGSPGHMRQNAYYSHKLKWPFENLLPSYCYAMYKNEEYNNPQASFATCLCVSAGKRANCALALSVSGASRSRLFPDGPRVHLSYMTSCMRPDVRFPLDQRILCGDCCKKCRLLCLGQVISYFVLHSSKIPLVLTTKVTHLRSLLFRQLDGLNCVVRRAYSGWCPKTEYCS